jgi:regulator of sigma D
MSNKHINSFNEYLNEGTINSGFLNRIESVVNEKDLIQFQKTLKSLTGEWLDEGFELEDIQQYINYLVEKK